MKEKLALILAAKIAAWAQVCGPFHSGPVAVFNNQSLTMRDCKKACEWCAFLPEGKRGVCSLANNPELASDPVKCSECQLKVFKSEAKVKKDIEEYNKKCSALEREAVTAFRKWEGER